MSINLSACPIRCTIGGVDYSAQVVPPYSLGYDMLGADKAGGALPFHGSIQLGCVANRADRPSHPINKRLDSSLFPLGAPVIFELQYNGIWYPLPALEIEQANYNSTTERATLVVGDVLYINSKVPQDVDSRALDIRIGGLRSGASVLARLLLEIGVADTDIQFEPDSLLRFRFPRNFEQNYFGAIDDIANSESAVVFSAPGGKVIVRETWTVADPVIAPAPLPVLGKYRYGQRDRPEDQVALERPLEQFEEIALPGSIGTEYSANVSYYEVHEAESTQISTSPDGREKTTTIFDFSQATVERTTRIREDGDAVYAGIAGQRSGEIESEERNEQEQYDRNEPGRLLSSEQTNKARVAKVAKSLVGWYSSSGDDNDLNDNGEVTANPFPGSLWSSMATTEEVEKRITYDSQKSTVMISEVIETRKIAISILDGLTNGVPWDLIIENSPVNLGSLTFASRESRQWIEESKGSWAIAQSYQTVHALADTGYRSAIIGGLQRASDLDDGNLVAYWLALAFKRVTVPRARIPASPDNVPPAFTPKPRRYSGVSASTTATVNYGFAGQPRAVRKSISIPFVSDVLAASLGTFKPAQDAKIILGQVARRDRMNALSYELACPAYPEILAGFSPYSAMDVYDTQKDATFRVITMGLNITGTNDETIVNCVAPTLARVISESEFEHPYQEIES